MRTGKLESGKYVVAVSGGVDSMVLLDLLAEQVQSKKSKVKSPKNFKNFTLSTFNSMSVELIVAHFDHGIRPDSGEDRVFVQGVACKYGLPFVCEEGKLGSGASEARARDVRYMFLRRVQKEQGARAIITAHHQDDVLETAILNLLRGTGRKGLSSLQSTGTVMRPLLDIPKKDLIEYARKHKLAWREDPTNVDERYLRNYVRRRIVPRFDGQAQQEFLVYIENARRLNDEIDTMLATVLQAQPGAHQLQRRWFAALPYDVSREAMAALLRQKGVTGFTRRQIERLVVAAKTLAPGKLADVDAGHVLRIEKDVIRLIARQVSKKSTNSV